MCMCTVLVLEEAQKQSYVYQIYWLISDRCIRTDLADISLNANTFHNEAYYY